MNVRAQQIEDELMNLHVDKGMYDLWKENEVTRQFFLWLESQYIDVAMASSPGGTIESIAIFEIARKHESETFKRILEWEPEF